MAIKMEFFSGDPPCQGCLDLLKIADEYAMKYAGELEVVKLIGRDAMAKFGQYRLTCTPAVVIDGRLKIEGVCPSNETLDKALAEAGYGQN